MQTSLSAAIDLPRLIERFDAVPGMMGRLSGASFAAVLQRQAARGHAGHIVEFGVYKGKSAFLLAHFAAPEQRLVLVDVHVHPEVHDIKAIKTDCEIVQASSVKYSGSSKAEGLAGKVRFLHVDGNHTFDNVAEDLEIAERFVSEDGLVVLDDFLNPHFSQVQAATYWHLYKRGSRFAVFLVGGNKAFLCNKGAHAEWLGYAVKNFGRDIAGMGYPVMLSRTDSNPLFDAVFFRGRKPEEAEIYGPQLYGHYFS